MTADFVISQHAVERYRERVKPSLSTGEARDIIRGHGSAISAAIAFGAPCIKLPCGARLVVADDTVVTVLPAEFFPPLPPRGGRY